MSAPADPRLILREDELDAGLELMLLAEASLWAVVDQGLEAEGVGVQELAHLTSLSKQAASRILVDLTGKGLAEKQAGDVDGRRRSAVLTARGEAFEAAISERLRSQLIRAYRTGGL